MIRIDWLLGTFIFLTIQIRFRTHKYFTRFCLVYIRSGFERHTSTGNEIYRQRPGRWNMYTYWKYMFFRRLTLRLHRSPVHKNVVAIAVQYCIVIIIYIVLTFISVLPLKSVHKTNSFIFVYTHTYTHVDVCVYSVLRDVHLNKSKYRQIAFYESRVLYMYIHFVRRSYLSS